MTKRKKEEEKQNDKNAKKTKKGKKIKGQNKGVPHCTLNKLCDAL